MRKQFCILFLLQSQPLGMSPHMPQSKRQEELWEIFRASLLRLKAEKEKISQRKKTEIFSLLCMWSWFLNPLYWISAFSQDLLKIFRMQRYKDVITIYLFFCKWSRAQTKKSDLVFQDSVQMVIGLRSFLHKLSGQKYWRKTSVKCLLLMKFIQPPYTITSTGPSYFFTSFTYFFPWTENQQNETEATTVCLLPDDCVLLPQYS